MVYGIPEAAYMAVEKQNTDQFFKCVDCALDGVDEIINSIYSVNGTILCLQHAKAARGIKIKSSYHNPNVGPAGTGYVTLD